jgi:hypothetical protein
MLTDDRIACIILARSAARIEDIERWIRAHSGVVECEVVVLIRQVTNPKTLDRLIDSGAGREPPTLAIGPGSPDR